MGWDGMGWGYAVGVFQGCDVILSLRKEGTEITGSQQRKSQSTI